MAKKTASKQKPIGDVLRTRRVDVLKKGLREMARIVSIAPAHLTDLEKGRRTPSEGLLRESLRRMACRRLTCDQGDSGPMPS